MKRGVDSILENLAFAWEMVAIELDGANASQVTERIAMDNTWLSFIVVSYYYCI
jgi:hypothetical protein